MTSSFFISETVSKVFPEIEKRISNFPYSMPHDSDVYLLMQIQENFNQEGRPKWPEFKKMPDPPRKLLDKNGVYKNSIEISREDTGWRLFTDCDYADYHEHLDKDYSRPPERKVFTIPNENLQTFADNCSLFLAMENHR